MIPCFAEALKAMEKVASHINEMQKIYEDYGTVFDQLVAEQSGTEREVSGTCAFREASCTCSLGLWVTFSLGPPLGLSWRRKMPQVLILILTLIITQPHDLGIKVQINDPGLRMHPYVMHQRKRDRPLSSSSLWHEVRTSEVVATCRASAGWTEEVGASTLREQGLFSFLFLA